MRKIIKKSIAVALSTAMVVTLGYAADIKTKAADDYTYLVKMKDRNFFQVMRDKLKAGGSGKKYN